MFILTGLTGPMAMVATAVTDSPMIDIGTEAMMVVGVATTDSTTRMDQRGSHMNQLIMHLGLALRTLRFLYLSPLIRCSHMRSPPNGAMGWYWKGIQLKYTGSYEEVLDKCLSTISIGNPSNEPWGDRRDDMRRRSNSIDARKIDDRLAHAAKPIYESDNYSPL